VPQLLPTLRLPLHLKWNRTSVELSGPKPPAQPLAPMAERLVRGEGLQSGEAPVWLKGLDRNSDGSLDIEEIQPLVDLLVKTRVGVLGTGRARGGGRGAAARGAAGRGRPAARDETSFSAAWAWIGCSANRGTTF
jgi:hypothetical protein